MINDDGGDYDDYSELVMVMTIMVMMVIAKKVMKRRIKGRGRFIRKIPDLAASLPHCQ